MIRHAVSLPVHRFWRAPSAVRVLVHRRRAAVMLEAAVVLGLTVLWLALMLPSLSRFPPINNDEGREANLFWVASGLEPGAERMNAYRGFPTWGNGGVQGATAVVLFRLLGLGVVQARLTSLIWGGALLLVVYWLGRWYWGVRVGLGAAALLAISDPFLLATHTLRPDIQVATLVLLALALVEYGLAHGKRWPHALAGVLLGLSFDTHMNTVGFLPLVMIAPLLPTGATAPRRPALWMLVAGLALAGVYYIAVRILPDPPSYLSALQYWVGIDKAPPLTREREVGLGGLVAAELQRYADYFGVTQAGIEEWPELALITAGLAASAWRAVRGSRADRILLLGLVAAMLFFTIAVSTKSRYYMVLGYPICTLLIARGCQSAVERVRPLLARHALFAALIVLAMVWPLKLEERALEKYVRASRYKASQEYTVLTARLRELAGPHARILAPPLYWIGLRDHPFVDIFVYERVRRQYGETASEFLQHVQPDIVITDAKIATDPTIERELYRALDDLAPYELITRHKSYGDVAIYRLSWPGRSPSPGAHDGNADAGG